MHDNIEQAFKENLHKQGTLSQIIFQLLSLNCLQLT